MESAHILLNTLCTCDSCLFREVTNIFKKLEGWYVNYILAEGMYTELRICEIQSNLATVRMFANFVASNLIGRH